MPLYEHTMLATHRLTSQQATTLVEEYAAVLTENGGAVIDSEYWGLRALAYRIRNNRKAHYAFMRIDAPSAAVAEMERRMRLNEDVIRILTVRIDAHEEGPTAIMRAKAGRDSRGGSHRDRDHEDRRDDDRRRGRRRGDRSGESAPETPVEATAEAVADSSEPAVEAGAEGTGNEAGGESGESAKTAKSSRPAESPGADEGAQAAEAATGAEDKSDAPEDSATEPEKEESR